MADPKSEAKSIVGEFANRSGTSVWKSIPRYQVAAGLLSRVDNPGLVDQSGSSLCGAAALIYDLAQDDPVKYVKFVIDLYEKGSAKLGTLDIKPGTDLKKYTPTDINRADWIALASIRDSTNWFLDYQSEKDEAAGVTLPSTLAGWFSRAGYTSVLNETNLFFCKGIDNAQKASELLGKGYKVALFINSNMLDKAERDVSGNIKLVTTHNTKSTTPDHWIVLRSAITFTPSITFKIYTWGDENMQVPRKGTLTTTHFLDNFYGYVACKY